jgi:hypothetical protein
MVPSMTTPFVLITTHRIKPGRLDELVTATRDYNDFVEANEPLVHAHVAYVDETRDEISLVQVHPDAASADNHLRIAGEHIGRGVELTETVAITVYGEPGPAVRQALEHNAEAGATVTVKPARLAGFLRT